MKNELKNMHENIAIPLEEIEINGVKVVVAIIENGDMKTYLPKLGCTGCIATEGFFSESEGFLSERSKRALWHACKSSEYGDDLGE